MASQWTWDDLLKMFRMLGGTADNIVVKTGARGRGLMASDPERPILVRVPRNLLFSLDDVAFEGDELKLRRMANFDEATRQFFDNYQAGFSWGAGGREESIAFIAALDALPADVRALLAEEFGFKELLEGDPLERAEKRFLESRLLRWDGQDFIMPLIELANHDPAGLPYRKEEDLNIQGKVKDEVLVVYGAHDTFSIFQTFGFVSIEPGAFSLPTRVQVEGGELLIFRDTGTAVQRGKIWAPQLGVTGPARSLSFLMIGHRSMPRQPRGVFRSLAREAHVAKPDECFDSVLQFNWAKFLRLLTALEPHDGEMVQTLRKMARIQLQAISHCMGSLDLEPQMPAQRETWSMSIE